MDIVQIQKTINEFSKLPIIEREKTVFDIGTRGHFENPTTDVLSFFCDSSEVHGMGSLIGDSMLSLLNQQYQLDIPIAQSPVQPEREVVTETGKRIDLVVNSEQWLLIIEAKVGHAQINPFDDYESYADNLAKKQGKRVVYAVLSPQGTVDDPTAHPRWVGISYNDLVKEIKRNLQQCFFDKPFNKWLLILKDFLLHLENLMTEQTLTQQQAQFVLQNLADISNAWQLLSDTLKKVDGQVQSSVPTFTQQVLLRKVHTWFQPLPAYIYQLQASQVEVILFASADGVGSDKQGNNEANLGKHLFVQVHVNKTKSGLLYQKICKQLETKVVNYWDDSRTSYLRWPIDELSIQLIADEVITTLSAIHSIELSELQHSLQLEIIS